MKNDAFTRHPALKRGQQFTGRDGIEAQTLRRHQTAHGQGAVGLRGIDRQRRPRVMRLQGLLVGTARRPQAFLVQHIQRSAVALGQLAEAASANHQTVLIIQLGRHRSQVAVRTGRIAVRFEGPQA